MADNAAQILEEVASEVVVCPDCELCRSRNHAVPGAGNATAEVFFIGEAPGMNEDKQGLPFVGNAGKFLNEMLESVDWDRESVFITNIVKCRPPGNRDPLPDEIEACSQYLDRQIAAIDPVMIVTLGRHSMSRWFANERISRIHGKPREADGRVIVPLYHPAAALHQPSLRKTALEDFRKLPLILEEFKNKPKSGDESDDSASQMKLF
jgi:uracil-DNA glycosylase